VRPGLPRIVSVGSLLRRKESFFSSIVIKDSSSEEILEGFAVAL
jgi:hypothetical protein